MDHIVHFVNGAAYTGQPDRTQKVFNPATGEAEKAGVFADVGDVARGRTPNLQCQHWGRT